MRRLLPLALLPVALAALAADGLPPGVKDTQKPGDVPPPPQRAADLFHPLPGFSVTLFAGEPHVSQPIALDFDRRGRLWVAECFSYPEWKDTGIDRVLIFDDKDGDGSFDSRKVFLDRLPNLTGLAVGHGGVWVLCAPKLLFYPDRDGDDVPDGKPVTVLDGWTLKAGHNIVNGLTWGPDGWLYGCHGITAESLVGPPGTPPEKRTRLLCSIWRYHPVKKTFEVVCHGTTNPWGVDFDDHGEAFFTNCVIGHLWHVVPGARYQRMYGRDYNPHAYELIASTSDHLHWGGGHWTSSRGGAGVHSEAGGGHAHAGTLIYLGDNWPAEYRNSLLTCNIHGNRLNRDLLVRAGCSYVGKHAPDFLTSSNPWFRGVDLVYGPGGEVYVSDWSDLGECHDNDGTHRTSGRIYRVAYGKTPARKDLDLAKKSDAELVELQLHKNDWYVRQARLILAERAAGGRDMKAVHAALQRIFAENPDGTRKLRALWALHVTGGTSQGWLVEQLGHADEHVRAWAIRLLVEDRKPDEEVRARFVDLAKGDPSGLVRLYLASAIQRMPLGQRFAIAGALAAHAEDAGDRVLPLLLWYGVEPAVTGHRGQALELAATSRIPKLRRFIARRLTLAEDPDGLAAVVALLGRAREADIQFGLLEGVREGLRGQRSAKMPAGWREAHARLRESPREEVRESARLLALTFDDPLALKELRGLLADRKAPAERRESALRALAAKGVEDLVPDLLALLGEPALRRPALQALAAYEDGKIPSVILERYPSFAAEEKEDAVATLTSRPGYALALLDAVAAKEVPRADVSVFAARQMQSLRDKRVRERLEAVWGQVRQSPRERKALTDRYKERLAPEVLAKADVANGRAAFVRHCASCHRLFGEGGQIGPDLTGSDRRDLHYVLENLIDPGAVVSGDYRLSNFYTTRGRLVSGIVVEENERAVTVQTATERLVLAQKEIDQREQSSLSMMPEGLAEKMTFAELRDLVAYLRAKDQVPLPEK